MFLPAFCLLAVLTCTAQSEWVTIENGKVWLDEEGDTVQAHAPGFLFEGDRWWMVGEDRTEPWHPDVNLYSSPDLVHWRFERKIVRNGQSHAELGTARMIERAKLLRNPRTGKYVLWCHWESRDYRASEAACFVSDSIRGDYRLAWSGRPLGIASRDCNVFQDMDGTAYFISTTSIYADNGELGLFRLSDDYLSVHSHTPLFMGHHREAPAIVRIGGTYWMLTSGTTGWEPNQCQLSRSAGMEEGWRPLHDVGPADCYDTQAAAILTIKGTRQTTYLYVGDRWKDPDLPSSKIIIFPLTFDGTTCHMHYRERFRLNLRTGEWR